MIELLSVFSIEYRPVSSLQSAKPLQQLNFARIEIRSMMSRTSIFSRQLNLQVLSLLLLGFCFLATGCQNRAASKLTGRWDMLPPEKLKDSASKKVDSNKDASTEKAANDTEDLIDSIAEGDDSVGTMSLVFHRNGKLETFTDFPMASTGKPKVGTWKLKSWDESNQTAVLECDLFDELTETKVTFIDNDTIQLVPPNIAVLEMELRFRRGK